VFVFQQSLEVMSNLVFSFGSNSTSQLRARVENPTLLAMPARAVGWHRIFCVYSPVWDGGAASIIPRKDSVTYGAAVLLTDNELAILDKYEYAYHKEPIDIDVWDAGKWEVRHAHAYIADDISWTTPPSEAYLTAIHIMLREQFQEIAAEQVHTIEVYGKFTKDMPAHDTAATEAVQNCKTASHYTNCQIEFVSKWMYPGAHALSLRALVVEINAARATKWVMPRAIVAVTDELTALGVLSVAQLAARLAIGWGVHVLEEEQRGILDHLDEEALGIAKRLLQLESIKP
jgi:hypothetical protein